MACQCSGKRESEMKEENGIGFHEALDDRVSHVTNNPKIDGVIITKNCLWGCNT